MTRDGQPPPVETRNQPQHQPRPEAETETDPGQDPRVETLRLGADRRPAHGPPLHAFRVSPPTRPHSETETELETEPAAVAVFAHGLGDHAERHLELARDLARRAGVLSILFDQRGHGRSPGPRGVVRSYDELLDDLELALREARAARLPLVLFGHSNGGLLVLSHILRQSELTDPPHENPLLVLSAPATEVAFPVPAWKIAAARLLRRAPRVTLPTELDPALLVSDPEIQRRVANDPLRHDRVNAPLYLGMRDAMRNLHQRAHRIRAPILLLQSERDPVVSSHANRRFLQNAASPDKTLLEIPEPVHEPLQDRDAHALRDRIVAWLRERIPEQPPRHRHPAP